jgi:transcriptional regulator with XRE-family HTH domain
MDLAARIISLREERGYNTRQLSILAGIGYSTLYEAEAGQKQPTVATLELICKALGITMSHFFAIDGEIIESLPDDIKKLVLNPENYEMLKEIQTMKASGHSSEVIIEWIRTLNTALDKTIKMYGLGKGEGKVVRIDEGLLVGESKSKYSEEEKGDIAEKLQKKLGDPNYKPPWNKK